MARTVNAGRYTVSGNDEVTVFLIGMRFGKFYRVDKWWPVFIAMPRMLAHLAKNPEVGMLSFDSWFGRTTMMLTYWRSPEDLQHFAADPDAPHTGPWRAFMRKLSGDPDVGIWHETYVVKPGQYEVLYGNMPAFGLGKALGVQPVGKGSATARQRLAGKSASAAA